MLCVHASPHSLHALPLLEQFVLQLYTEDSKHASPLHQTQLAVERHQPVSPPSFAINQPLSVTLLELDCAPPFPRTDHAHLLNNAVILPSMFSILYFLALDTFAEVAELAPTPLNSHLELHALPTLTVSPVHAPMVLALEPLLEDLAQSLKTATRDYSVPILEHALLKSLLELTAQLPIHANLEPHVMLESVLHLPPRPTELLVSPLTNVFSVTYATLEPV